MPKSSPIQTNFSGGELGPLVEGRVETDKHHTGLETCQNYLPTIEGPLIRLPGTKRVASVKDPSKPPRFIPFKFSNTEQYIIEMGERYMRFFTDEGQVVTSGTSYVVTSYNSLTHLLRLGNLNTNIGSGFPTSAVGVGYGSRSNRNLKINEVDKIGVSPATIFSSVVSGALLEFATPYDYNMISGVGFAQKGDTLWIMHSSIPTHTLQRVSPQDWDLKPFHTKDGPYLPLNTYKQKSDYVNKQFYLDWGGYINQSPDKTKYEVTVVSHSSVGIANVLANTSGIEVRTAGVHPFSNADKVWIAGVTGTSEINNGSSQISSLVQLSVTPNPSESSVWSVNVISQTSFLIPGLTLVNAYVGSGKVWPALFSAEDAGRNIGFYAGGQRYYGVFSTLGTLTNNENDGSFNPHPIAATVSLDPENNIIPIQSTIVTVWQMGAYNRYLGWPSAGAFHQNRLLMTGIPGLPTEFDGSRTGDFQFFSPSVPQGSTSFTVVDTNALQFNLVSDSQDQLLWIKPAVQGLYMGSNSAEFLVSPSKEGQALTPTNINNDIIGNYGSANVNPARFGDSVIYLQNSQRKVRELRFFANLQSHRSTQINQLSDHIGLPQILGLTTQKETYPMVWGYRSDGKLISMAYARDDSQAITGWAQHTLGGQSDSGGSEPKVKAIEVIRDSTGRYDQLWMAVQRYINGTSDVVVEYMVEPYRHKDPAQKQRDAFYLHCGATYDSSFVVASISSGSAFLTVSGPILTHNLNRNDLVLVSDVVGLNSSLIDINGVVFGSNLVNEKVFIVGSTTGFGFYLQDFNSSVINANFYSPYVSGGKVRKLVSSVGGLTWLKNETVDLLGDGGIQGQAVVNSAGVVALTNPAAVVQIGYAYKSRGKTLSKDNGSATGSAIGMQRKLYEAAFKLKDVGDFAWGGIDFNNLHKADFGDGDSQQADSAVPLYSGVRREGLEGDVDFYGQLYFEQSSPLPGMIQSITYLMDEYDN